MNRITEEKRDFLLEFIMQHPPVDAAIGYGSGVIPQFGDNDNTKEMDLILVVHDLKDWLIENLIMHPEEFTKQTMKYFEKASLKELEKGAPIVYFSKIPFKDKNIKFGIISTNKFLSSCYERTSSYIPFRTEKPIVELFTKNKDVHEAIFYDKKTALLTALLMLKKEELTEYQLMEKICSLSYLGDFRMKIHCEDPNKIKNLVNGQLSYFIEDYNSINEGYYQKDSNDNIKIKYERIKQEIPSLPKVFQNVIKDIPLDIEHNQELSSVLENFYKNDCSKDALRQAIKGFKTTGIEKAVTYGLRKVKKGRAR